MYSSTPTCSWWLWKVTILSWASQTQSTENHRQTMSSKQPKWLVEIEKLWLAGNFSSYYNSLAKCQVRCTGVLPYHTCPHHLHWRWLSFPRSGRVCQWFCCRVDRSGLASGSGHLGFWCGFRCKTWNQQSAAAIPAQMWDRRKQREGQ